MKKLLLTLGLIFLSMTCFAQETLVQQRPDVQRFINYMNKRYHFDKHQLTAMFNTIPVAPPHSDKVAKDHPVLHRMKARHDFIPWYQYKTFFIDSTRINLGTTYWKKNAYWLNKAYKEFGVPQSIIAATLGIESKYGNQMGGFPVFQSLAVLAFDYPRRKSYFTRQLISFLIYCKGNRLKTLDIHGSYAGAIGQPQFMPSNLKMYTVDFDHKGKIDIIHDPADAIGSVAKFYHINHWKKDEPVALQAIVKGKKLAELLKHHHRPKFNLSTFKKYGVTPQLHVNKDYTATLLTLKGKHAPQYWLVFHNFFVIKNYNDSSDYAMALFQLSASIKNKYHAQLTKEKQEHEHALKVKQEKQRRLHKKQS